MRIFSLLIFWQDGGAFPEWREQTLYKNEFAALRCLQRTGLFCWGLVIQWNGGGHCEAWAFTPFSAATSFELHLFFGCGRYGPGRCHRLVVALGPVRGRGCACVRVGILLLLLLVLLTWSSGCGCGCGCCGWFFSRCHIFGVIADVSPLTASTFLCLNVWC